MTEEDFDEIAELMAEPPHGANHGREKNDQGGWTSLESPTETPRSTKHYVETATAARNRLIRYLLAEGYSVERVATSFGMSQSSVWKINPGRSRGRPKKT